MDFVNQPGESGNYKFSTVSTLLVHWWIIEYIQQHCLVSDLTRLRYTIWAGEDKSSQKIFRNFRDVNWWITRCSLLEVLFEQIFREAWNTQLFCLKIWQSCIARSTTHSKTSLRRHHNFDFCRYFGSLTGSFVLLTERYLEILSTYRFLFNYYLVLSAHGTMLNSIVQKLYVEALLSWTAA